MMNNLSGGITSKGKLNGSLAIGKIGSISECKKNVYVGESPEEYTGNDGVASQGRLRSAGAPIPQKHGGRGTVGGMGTGSSQWRNPKIS